MSGREKRFMRDTNHCVSKKLANQPLIAVFVLEDLSSIRTQRRGKKMNKWLGSWAFYQQEQFLTYKAEALGKRVAYQDARYTSQKCNICKHIRKTNRHKSKFCCKNCGHWTHADFNAAKMSVMTIFSPLPTGRRSRGQSIPRMFQPSFSASYKPHPLVGGAVDSRYLYFEN
ncbi:hypothetical protein A6770_25095 [Nostoc minutum NIES-26]|uniref:Cas12f1-like TNB domain-containing protein n=1 Tax=Nostoc minutum NIES-26 TaxID=1844469 RepID=A0A367QWW9_9NOSO|nr:hypothetical protein A6770_25095 [Nostoc minutum NIES-26]